MVEHEWGTGFEYGTKKMGRPPRAEDEKCDTYSIRLTKKKVEAIRLLCPLEDTSLSMKIVAALDKFIEMKDVTVKNKCLICKKAKFYDNALKGL
jgi:hypothetical protein